MPPWAISSDLKVRISVLRSRHRKILVYQTLQLYDKLANVTNSNLRKLGRRSSFSLSR
ncbi:hypothetical protein BDR04DRAFT_1096395 [Suillus decipiens]|nr:hypothetical protein BDR04DRAFT_1096395 [Suillus decipiens]